MNMDAICEQDRISGFLNWHLPRGACALNLSCGHIAVHVPYNVITIEHIRLRIMSKFGATL